MEEVEQLCSRIVIMDKGRTVAAGTKEELGRMIKNTETIRVELPVMPDGLQASLDSVPHLYESSYSDEVLTLKFSGGSHNIIRVVELLTGGDIAFGRIVTELPTLNDVFLEITGRELRD